MSIIPFKIYPEYSISTEGLELIKYFEALRLEAYTDQPGVWTIGYGTTRGVIKGMKITKEKAEELLMDDIKYFQNGINKLIKVSLNQNQYDAIVSFVYNVGLGSFKASTMLRMINLKNFLGASDQFTRWVYITILGKKVVSRGLRNRRLKERELFLKEITQC